MRGSIIVSVFSGCAFAACLAQAAAAADLEIGVPTPKPVIYVSPYFDWQGIYLGAFAGGAWGNARWATTGTTVTFGTGSSAPAFTLVYPEAKSSLGGFVGGGQIGINFQSEAWVWGFTAAFSGMHVTGSVTDILGEVDTTNVNWSAELSMRAGYTFERMMLYGRVGAVLAQDSHTAMTNQVINVTVSGCSSATPCPFFGVTPGTATRFGYLLGVGGEFAFDKHWSVFGEYDYMSFVSQLINFPGAGTSFPTTAPTPPATFSAPTAQRNIDLNLQRFIAGVNYRFY